VALPRRNRAVAPAPADLPDTESEGFPAWVISSVMDFVAPFLRGEGMEASDSMGYPHRNFLRELERNLQQPLDWRQRERSAWASLIERFESDPSLLVDVVDFALHNILLGTYFQNCEAVAGELDRALRESGAVWRVGRIEGQRNSVARKGLARARLPLGRQLGGHARTRESAGGGSTRENSRPGPWRLGANHVPTISVASSGSNPSYPLTAISS